MALSAPCHMGNSSLIADHAGHLQQRGIVHPTCLSMLSHGYLKVHTCSDGRSLRKCVNSSRTHAHQLQGALEALASKLSFSILNPIPEPCSRWDVFTQDRHICVTVDVHIHPMIVYDDRVQHPSIVRVRTFASFLPRRSPHADVSLLGFDDATLLCFHTDTNRCGQWCIRAL